MYTDNGLSLCETKDKCRKTKGRGGSRLWLRFATPRQQVNETLASPDNETTSGVAAGWLRRNYGFMESRIDGIMELRKGQVGSKLMAHCPKETR